jgi:hypothetical protein
MLSAHLRHHVLSSSSYVWWAEDLVRACQSRSVRMVILLHRKRLMYTDVFYGTNSWRANPFVGDVTAGPEHLVQLSERASSDVVFPEDGGPSNSIIHSAHMDQHSIILRSGSSSSDDNMRHEMAELGEGSF